jgi:hypothetical protein
MLTSPNYRGALAAGSASCYISDIIGSARVSAGRWTLTFMTAMHRYLWFIPILVLFQSCSTRFENGPAVTDAVDVLIPEAKQYFSELRDQGRLPGCVKEDHGQLFIKCALWDEGGHLLSKDIAFPFEVRAYLYVTNRPIWVTNLYSAWKVTRSSGWQLEGAWRLEEGGKWMRLQ